MMGIQDYEWPKPFDRLLSVSEDRRLHVYLITHEFNKRVLMFKETDELPLVSRASEATTKHLPDAKTQKK